MINRLGIKKLYTWCDQIGNKHVLAATSLSDAKLILLRQEKPFFKLTHHGYLTRYSFKKNELAIITQQLSTMLSAGLPIIESLTLLAEQHHLAQWQWLLNELKHHIMIGEQISQTLSYYPEIFSALYQQIIATGELTGQLEQCFEVLAIQLDNSLERHNKVKKAMRYPLFLFSVSLIISMVMLMMVLPKFTEIYQSFDAQLPAFTQLMMDVSNLIQNHFISIVLLGIIALMFYFGYIAKHYKPYIDQFSLKLPIFGQIITCANLAQIFQTLFMTQCSGIALLTGLSAAQKTALNGQFERSLKRIIEMIEQGQSFSQALCHHSIFPSFCVQLIRIGEESGTLEIMLSRLAENYQQKSFELTDNLSKKIEPIMMSLMAIIIGSLVIAMYLPVFQLGSVIH
ncbi:protein transport protein HofC [Orbus hercynius]|uniref:Protein transport protein HofC n=1 Tax=Orbus hercynius TaxID=593135 RepID=A0A495RHE0_9GAMM|nr:type II secretion system F family protein [Orbus hercynius]RKS86841.1 protein transport protein HofC [Orbus hercynius]